MINIDSYYLKINDKNQNRKYLKFCKLAQNLKIKEFDFTKPIFEILYHKGLLEKIFLEKKFYNSVVNLLGRDLAFCTDPGITLNLPNKTNPQENYLFKDWHQEIWSGASPLTIQIWTPLNQKDSNSGQMEFIQESHKWGHVPHINRKPTILPKNLKTKTLSLEYGDVFIFSTLLIHRSLPTKSPRLSLPCHINKFKVRYNYFQNYSSFKFYSNSEITKIERILGNHFLSPFRLTSLDDDR